MTFHIVTDRPIDLGKEVDLAADGEQPALVIAELRDRLGAIMHAPASLATSRFGDRLRSKLVGSPETWALARRLRERTGHGDTIFCTSQDTGLVVAELVGGRPGGPRVAMMVQDLGETRVRAALRFFELPQKVDLCLSPSWAQIEMLSANGFAEAKCLCVADSTDVNFFSPGPANEKERPLVVSVGLARRDYRTLAEAVGSLDLDVRISGFPRDAARLEMTLPAITPPNFNQRFYESVDLAQLYRDADVVIVPVKAGESAAGSQSLLEAMASGRPVVVTESEGLRGYLEDHDAITVVPQRDPVAMRNAVEILLSDPDKAAERGRRGREIALERYSQTKHVAAIVSALKAN